MGRFELVKAAYTTMSVVCKRKAAKHKIVPEALRRSRALVYKAGIFIGSMSSFQEAGQQSRSMHIRYSCSSKSLQIELNSTHELDMHPSYNPQPFHSLASIPLLHSFLFVFFASPVFPSSSPTCNDLVSFPASTKPVPLSLAPPVLSD